MTQSCGQCLWFGRGNEWRFAESAACQHPTTVSIGLVARPDAVQPPATCMLRTDGAHCPTFVERTKETKTP